MRCNWFTKILNFFSIQALNASSRVRDEKLQSGTFGASLNKTHPNSGYETNAEGNNAPCISVQKLDFLDRITKGIFGDDAKPVRWDSRFGSNKFEPWRFGNTGVFDFSRPPNSFISATHDPKAWPADPRRKQH